jgi:hypothetical protein
MSVGMRRKFVALGLGVVFCLGAALLSDVPHCDWLGVMLLPGALVGVLLSPEGIHGSFPIGFMVLSGVSDCLLYAAVFYWLLCRAGERGVEGLKHA